MLTLLAFAMIAVFMALIMTKRMSVLTALILVPIAFALARAASGASSGPMMLDGVKALAPTAVMLLFAILFFSIMIDVGLFEPVVERVVRLVQRRSAARSSSARRFSRCSSRSMAMARRPTSSSRRRCCRSTSDSASAASMLASVIMQAGGVMNILPWGGPTARAASALKVDASEIFVPMIPAMIAGAAWVIFVAYMFGKRERARVGVLDAAAMTRVEDARR